MPIINNNTSQPTKYVDIKNKPLIFLGRFTYRKCKSLSLYLWYTDKLPKIEDLKCNYTFEIYNRTFYELDEFKYASILDIESYVCKSMNKVLKVVFRKMLK